MNALILVDLQNDFLPGGALGVPGGDELIPIANRLQRSFDKVVATKDWHPPNHCSFASQHPGHEVGDVVEVNGLSQVLWPDHCIENTPGSEFPSSLNTERIEKVIHKGTDPQRDSYSGFFDNGNRVPTGLGRYLHQQDVDEVHVMGLATDYCVRATAIDAARLGFDTYLVENACHGVEIAPGDCQRAIEEMQRSGVRVREM
ncbi:MAG: bifunctional nicotinamidase/pyrazinamidase [Rhodopirellula sp. JB044]|uniref:bifunctional nicotinamidase/pyrazinamidase n=1 Tax=Rhodopirellula sp. JB044 TaxID=3342844 RepID=UPI00370A03B0